MQTCIHGNTVLTFPYKTSRLQPEMEDLHKLIESVFNVHQFQAVPHLVLSIYGSIVFISVFGPDIVVQRLKYLLRV